MLFLVGIVLVFVLAAVVDGCEHRNDYKVASKDLTILGGSLVGDVKAITKEGDTVFVYGQYSTFWTARMNQTRFWYLEPVGFTPDSVVVKPY